MTALSLSSIPSAINSYERLMFWAAQALQDIANGQAVNVLQNQGSVPRVQVQLSKVADGTDTAIVSAYIPVNWDEINSSSAKSWMAALDIGTAAPNTAYLSN